MFLLSGSKNTGYSITEATSFQCVQALYEMSAIPQSSCVEIFNYLKLNNRIIYPIRLYDITAKNYINILTNSPEEFIEKFKCINTSFYIIVRARITNTNFHVELVDIHDTNLATTSSTVLRRALLDDIFEYI